MNLERPDLSEVTPEIRAYIEALEVKLAQTQVSTKTKRAPDYDDSEASTDEFTEPPTTLNVITVSAGGIIKRTPRHLYTRQRRGGMGVFDLDVPEQDPPTLLAVADQNNTLVVFTNQGRTYRLPVSTLPESIVRARGVALSKHLPLRPDEHIVALLPEDGGSQVALVGERGWVNVIRASFVGSSLIPGTMYHDAKKHGPLAAACWANSDEDLFIATKQGLAIRFAVKRVPPSGCLGIRLDKSDVAIAIAAVDEGSGLSRSSSVFLLSTEGKGSIRLMSGFRANKSPGGGGKHAIKAEELAGAVAVDESDDLFVISRHSKIIRFQAKEIPPKTGTVQGVNCVALRGDEATACTSSGME